MPAQSYVTGPGEMHVGTGTSGALEFLGWSEAGFRVTHDAAFEDVMSDVSGPRIPFDVLAIAMQSFVVGDLTVYDENVFRKLMNRVNRSGDGLALSGDVGFLMRQERNAATGKGAFRTLLFYPYGTKSVFSGSMDTCHNYPISYPADAIDLEVGTKAKRCRVMMRCIPNWTSNNYSYTLYDHSSTGRVQPTIP